MSKEKNKKVSFGNDYIRLLNGEKDKIDQFCLRNKYIYRFIPLERFLETIHKKQLTFVSPTKWKDPFDNFLFKSKILNKNTFLNKLYVGCFTLNPHSQAYWKTYAPKGYGVRLRFETRKLFNLIISLDEKTWFGELNYKQEKDIIEIFQNELGLKDALENDTISNLFLNVFTLKRMPFEFEKEVRILIESSPKNDGIRRVTIDLLDIINDIYLDPRIKENEEKAIKTYIKSFGFSSSIVRKSRLFEDKHIKLQ